jgi:uncharacterized protein YcbK (DUF882 family)
MSLDWTRRRFIGALLAGGGAWPLTRLSHAGQALDPRGAERWLELVNTHTGEAVSVAYRAAGAFAAAAVAKLEWVLRDHRTNERREMDRALFDQLADLALAAGREARFEIISGYRSPASNAKLADAGRGVARRSLHVEGRAIDVRLKGLDCARLRDVALAMRRGGVGYYARSSFVHLDTGRVRHWSG